MKTRKYALALMLLLSSGLAVFAQTDTINAGNHKLITADLKPGMRQYLVYFQLPKQRKIIWNSNQTVDCYSICPEGKATNGALITPKLIG